jgi:hypothetical protein
MRLRNIAIEDPYSDDPECELFDSFVDTVGIMES